MVLNNTYIDRSLTWCNRKLMIYIQHTVIKQYSKYINAEISQTELITGKMMMINSKYKWYFSH